MNKLNLLLKKTLLLICIVIGFSDFSYGINNYDYKNCNDSIISDITIDKSLKSDFFSITEKSYPWYISKRDDGTFESHIGREITKDDLLLIEHTSNCTTDHQGNHMMQLCDAKLKSGVIHLEIYGGEPAYSNSFLVKITGNKFYCYFRANYPVYGHSLKWNILAKELKLKDKDFKKGRRIYAWVFVKFEETAIFRGETTKKQYTISGYLKPILK